MLIKTCSYCEKCIDSLLRDQIILGLRDNQLQEQLLRERKLTLDKCIDTCRAAEYAQVERKEFRPEVVNKIRHNKKSFETNHFASKCSSSFKINKDIHQLNSESSSDQEEWVNKIGDLGKDIKCVILINKIEVTFQLDVGATVNVLPKQYATGIEPCVKNCEDVERQHF